VHGRLYARGAGGREKEGLSLRAWPPHRFTPAHRTGVGLLRSQAGEHLVADLARSVPSAALKNALKRSVEPA
jgi:hypothetical protein